MSISARSLARHLGVWGEQGRGPAYERLASAVQALVLDGRLAVRTRMPAERELAAALGVSRTTVTAAYARLRETGFLLSRQGAGSWTAMPGARSGRAPLGPPTDGGDLLDLAIAAPPPSPDLEAAVAELPERLVAHRGDHGYHPAGLPALRQAIAARHTARGVPTSADQILVTDGAQAAIDLLARKLLTPRDVALVENPTYPNAVDALRRTGARLVPVGLPAGGYDVALLADALTQLRPRLAYLIPDFHNPTGLLLPEADRPALVAAARAAGAVLVVDETIAELPLEEGPTAAPVAGFDHDGRVITVGSLSKTVWGGLRVGWIRASAALVAELAEERAIVDMGGAVPSQLLALRLLDGLDDALPARRRELAVQRDALEAALRRHCPDWRWATPAGGLSLWVTLDAPVSTALVDAAGRLGVRLAAGPRFGIDGTLERFLRLPYVLPVDALEDAVGRIAHAATDLAGQRRLARPRSVVA